MFINATQPALTGSPIARDDYLRADPDALAAMWLAEDARIMLLSKGNPLLSGTGALIWVTRDHPLVGAGERIFLGTESGAPRFAIALGEAQAPEGTEFAEMRAALFGTGLEGDEAAIAAEAKALANWHHLHPRCARCGEPSVIANAGWRRDCPSCGAAHFPRTDPVVIMLVVNGERCAIARNVNFPGTLYSCIAGFVEPGESIEEAVRRETLEELGLRAGRVAYVSSQPWPFPASLMLGCIAETADTEFTLEAAEIADARWFTRDELRDVFEGRNPEVSPPRKAAIARDLALDWLEGRIGF